MRRSSLLALSLLGAALVAHAQTAAPTPVGPAIFKSLPTTAEKKGVDYLVAHQDEKTGAWLPQVGPAITAMVVRGLVQGGKSMEDPSVVKGLAFIETCHQKDGGYYKDSNPNYNSAIVLSMFSSLPGGKEKFRDQIVGLQTFLKSLQQDETKKDDKGNAITKENPWYGGSGYGEDRPDLSNTAYMIEALHDSGLPGNDPAIQKALIFVTRSQMNSETNSMAFAKNGTDGGFIYTPVNGGDSKFGDIDRLEGDSVLRSYGSMTYSGFKSLLYAGLTKEDPRVKAAVKWIQNNWTLDYNPGSASSDGQYYFYNAFSKAMLAWGEESVTDVKGVKHQWRAELVGALTKAQLPDGSWINPKSPRWFEGNPVLVTAYGVLCLQETRK